MVMSMVLLVMLLVLLSIQQHNLTIIQHNLKTDTPKEVEINKEFKCTFYTVIMSFIVVLFVIIWLKNYIIKHTILDSTFNYLMSQLTL